MKNKNRYFLLLLYLSLIGITCQPSQKLANTTTTPNIVILFCDDLGYGDLSSYGHPTINTPNLDKMAAQGMKFTNFYSASPACTASRYALLTGKYPVQSGFGWVLYPKSPRGIHPKELTIAEALKSKGYHTACYGKWHLGTTKKEYLPLQNGFDEYLGLPYSNDMIPPKWEAIPLLEGNDTLELNPDQRQLTRKYTERTKAFISKHKNDPFFIYLPYAMPHVPLHPHQEFNGTSKRGLYGDVVEEIDWSVGEILAHLEKENLAQNTLVFFTSDNGPWLIKEELGGSAGLLRDGKGSTWEGGMKVPAIAYWKGKIKGGQLNTNVYSTMDMKAQCLNLAGEATQPRLFDATEEGKRDVPFFYYGNGNKLFAVRKGKWKLHIKTYSQLGIDYFDGKLPLLFDLDTDPSELYDVAGEFPAIVEDLKKEITLHQENINKSITFFDNE